MSESLTDMLDKFTDDLSGCMHASVVDVSTGLALVAKSNSTEVSGEGTDAFHADLYRMSQKLLADLPMGDEPREIVMRSQQATFVSTPLESTGYILLVVTGADTTVGFIQAMMRKHASRIEEGVGALVG